MGNEDLHSRATEMVKRILTVGVGAIFLTEDALRSLVSEFKLPKEFLTGVLDSAGKTKDQFFSKLSSDVMDRVMTKVDPRSLMNEILDSHDIEMNVRLSFKRKKEEEGRRKPSQSEEEEQE